ncbi:MAG TPA: MBL fold metallo-hydrolase [Candidatus Aquilonibacter sp.]|nr:MBL fold metallo-hydrolase [Candidatus Aquilonibacter sp.]
MKRRRSRVPRSARGIPFWMRKLGQLWRLVRESHEAPLEGEPRVPLAVAEHEAGITFIGHSSFLLQMGGHNVLVDPVFATRLILLRRKRVAGVRVKDLPRIDAVLLTHAHMDHLNRPSLRAVNREMRRRKVSPPVAIVPHGVEDLVADLGFSAVSALRWWQSVDLGELNPMHITMTPAKHWGARLFNDTHRGFGGYLLEARGLPRIYHSGDTAYFPGFAEIGRRLAPDIALLPIGAYYPDSYRAVHTSPEEALRAFLDLDAQVMIPMHYNTFRLGREPMDEPLPRLLKAAASAGVAERVHPLAEGESWIAPSTLTTEFEEPLLMSGT